MTATHYQAGYPDHHLKILESHVQSLYAEEAGQRVTLNITVQTEYRVVEGARFGNEEVLHNSSARSANPVVRQLRKALWNGCVMPSAYWRDIRG